VREPVLLGLGRLAAVVLEQARVCVRLVLVPAPLGLGLRERLAVVVGLLPDAVRQVVRQHLHDGRLLGADELDAVRVHDVAARRLDPDLAHAVLARDRDVVLARQHLQEPETEEHDAEQDEREAAEHGDPPRQLRRDRPNPFRDALRHQAREIGLSPPVV
jgi:hypothetical protein